MELVKIERAILSVYDKTGIDRLGKVLADNEVHILSTGGTSRHLTDANIAFQEVSDYTGSPEMLGGRVKTLHPVIHGGLLFKRQNQEQVDEADRYGILPIDLVAVNLYPFEQTVSQPDVTVDQATENIDIGGPTMIRAGAKNFQSVIVLTDPSDYDEFIREYNDQGGISLATRRKLAAKAFEHTSRYDAAITKYLAGLS